MKIIKPRKVIETIIYFHDFEREDKSGYRFECDVNGNIEFKNDIYEENYNKCISGYFDGLVYKGIRSYTHSYTEVAIGECVCGDEVELHGFTNTCEACDRDYNGSGQLLAPREQWGGDTFESLSDILNIR